MQSTCHQRLKEPIVKTVEGCWWREDRRYHQRGHQLCQCSKISQYKISPKVKVPKDFPLLMEKVKVLILREAKLRGRSFKNIFMCLIVMIMFLFSMLKYYAVNFQVIFFQSIIYYLQLKCDKTENAGESSCSRYSISAHPLPRVSQWPILYPVVQSNTAPSRDSLCNYQQVSWPRIPEEADPSCIPNIDRRGHQSPSSQSCWPQVLDRWPLEASLDSMSSSP